jgi:hypothetical protein
MGYDAHITRAGDWMDSTETPIVEAEWLAVVHADPSLTISTTDYSDSRRADGSIERRRPVLWEGAALWYQNGEIRVKNPDQATLFKLIELSVALKARVLGDDGEEYT